MLYTKFLSHGPAGFWEDFWRVSTTYGHGSHLGHMTQIVWTNFRSPIPLRLHMKFGFDWLLRDEFSAAYLAFWCILIAFLMFQIIHVFRPEGEIWDPVRQDIKIFMSGNYQNSLIYYIFYCHEMHMRWKWTTLQWFPDIFTSGETPFVVNFLQ